MNAQRRTPATQHRRISGRTLLLSFASLLTLVSLPGHAIELLSTTNFVVAADERQEEELWLATDGEVLIEGTAADDLLILAGRFDLQGTAEGDLWLMSGQAVVGGDAQQQVRVVAQSLVVTGRVGRSLAAAAGTIQVTSNTVVDGDALLAADTITVSGSIQGDLRLMANHVTLQGRVGGDVRLVADDIVLLPGTTIEGDLVYTSREDLVPGKGVTVGGDLEQRELTGLKVTFTQRLMSVIFHTLGALLTGLVALRLFPATMGRAARLARHMTGRCILLGVAVVLIVPLASFVAVLVTVTRPLGLMAGGLVWALMYVGKIVVGLVLGGALLRYRGAQGFGQAVAALGAGLAVLYILSALPTIGFVVWLAASTMGLGALLAAFVARSAPPPVPPGALDDGAVEHGTDLE